MTRPASSLTSTLEHLQCSLHHGFWLLTARGLLSLCVCVQLFSGPRSPPVTASAGWGEAHCDPVVLWQDGVPSLDTLALALHKQTDGHWGADRWVSNSSTQYSLAERAKGTWPTKRGKRSLFVFLRYTVYTDYYLQLSEDKYRIQRCYSGNQLIGQKLISLHSSLIKSLWP